MVRREDLIRRWVHSHEEDTEAEMVFRAADAGYQFPRARGRASFELREDGTYVERVPGATDRPEDRLGAWELQPGDTLVLDADQSGPRQLGIVAAEGDLIRIKKS